MPVKLLMCWNIRPELESEYFEFVVSEFIPSISRLGLTEIQAWYTIYGNCEQIQLCGITNSVDQMRHVLLSEDWINLVSRLSELVTGLRQKVVRATSGFQI